MTDIQVGEYVRTIAGYISKVKEVTDDWIECESAITKHYEDTFDSLYSDEFDTITKHSFNIIDLIEVGDYVNGKLVTTVEDNLVGVRDASRHTCTWYANEHIKTIVTKEQFKAMEYKVGGEND